MVGRSNNVTGPFIDRDGKSVLEGGGTFVLEGNERWMGQGHSAVLLEEKGDWLVHHAYDAENKSTLIIRHLYWSEDGWPIAGEQIVQN